jgi:autotransporter-associated beta strand protein
VNSNLDLAQNNTFFTNVAAFQLGNSITNSGTINKTGAGVVSVVRDNSGWSGGMNINEGEVVIYANANAMGTGTWTLGGGANNTLLTVGTLATFSNSGGLVIGAGTGTRTIANAATNVAVGNATLSGAITNNKDVIFNIANYASGTDRMTVSGAIGGTGGIVKTNAGTLALSGSNSYTGTTTVSAGTLALTNGSAIADTATVSLDNASGATLQINTSETIGSLQGGGTTGGNVSIASSQTLTVAEAATNTYSGAINGAGGLTKAGNGTLILGGNNTYSDATAVTGGVLNLNNSAGESLGSTASVSVTNATLLISQSDQVKDSAAVSLSGGTIQRGIGVSETFGALSLDANSTIDFGTGATGTMAFRPGVAGGFTPAANTLTVLNFLAGNILSFGSSSALFTPGTYAGGYTGSGFDFGTQGFTASFASSTFTITAIPEPSTVLAAIGLAGLMLWPAARRKFLG